MIAKTEDRGDVRIVRCAGRVSLGSGPEELRHLITTALSDGKKAIVIDWNEVYFVDTTGLAEIVAGLAASMNHKVMFALAGLESRIQSLFGITGLHTIVPTFHDASLASEVLSAIEFPEFVERTPEWTSGNSNSVARSD